MSIFKAYDVRGTYPDQLDEDLARRIGESFVHLLSAKSLVVGRDMRDMAPSVADAFIEGAARAGARCVRIGLASTPMTYYAIGSLGRRWRCAGDGVAQPGRVHRLQVLPQGLCAGLWRDGHQGHREDGAAAAATGCRCSRDRSKTGTSWTATSTTSWVSPTGSSP